MHGLGKKLGFKYGPLWHSFEKIPFDVPPHILYPEAAAALFGNGRDRKEQYSGHPQRDQPSPVYVVDPPQLDAGASNNRRSRDDIIQRPADQQSIHQQELEEQDRAEAEALALKLQCQTLRQSSLQVPMISYSPASSSSSSSISLPSTTSPPQPHQHQHYHHQTSSHHSINNKAPTTRMVTSEEVLNQALCQRTATRLFLSTNGSHSRIVNLHGKPQSPLVLDWEASPPQKVEFLKAPQDIYVVGFQKSSITIFSLTRACKVKRILKKDLVHAADASFSTLTSTSTKIAAAAGGNEITNSGTRTSLGDISGNNASAALAMTSILTSTSTLTSTSASPSNIAGQTPSPTSSSLSALTASAIAAATAAANSSSIKFLGRDNIAVDSLGIFFSYLHPRNGTSICKLGIVPLPHDDLELVGYYP
ncbi:hypothetical protein BC939DRAFT_468870 [Gamsiella multidivaricata]|uniref:uncharacterized protein n=1 Tax=Gamsiella multidivaricata TaxID=101098 RepID=UPI00221F7571|nr:uncharacterized protein BC939DRAFT_468870 [Gamsiella multidivaricata]KAI7816523.1 hypothetical protein BC939DRAFT_468870 [Gamsiella multidivaricata]